MPNCNLPPDYDLNALLDKLDADDRHAVHALHTLTKQLVARHGDLTPDKSTWTDKHYLVYVLHNTIMALLRRNIRPVAFGIAAKLDHCAVLRQEKGNA